jgi:hypothetical protein
LKWIQPNPDLEIVVIQPRTRAPQDLHVQVYKYSKQPRTPPLFAPQLPWLATTTTIDLSIDGMNGMHFDLTGPYARAALFAKQSHTHNTCMNETPAGTILMRHTNPTSQLP